MTSLPDAPAFKLSGVELFGSGLYRGDRWSPAVVRHLANKAKELGPAGLKLFTPPVVVGHGDGEGEFPDSTATPAVGQIDVTTIRAVPDTEHPGELKLVADLVNVPQATAQKIANRELFRCSIEAYDSFLDDFGNDHGKVLRRLSLLGGFPGQVKRLKSLPMPEPMTAVKHFAERKDRAVCTRFRTAGKQTFAEGSVLDKPGMIAAVQAVMPGMSQAALESLDDAILAEMVKNLPPPAPPVAPPIASPPGIPSAATTPEPSAMTREQMIAALTEAGQDPAALQAMDDAALKAAYDALGAAPEAEVTAMADPTTMTREELIAALVAAGQDAVTLEAKTDDELRAMLTETSGAAPGAAAPVAAMGDKKKPITMYSEQKKALAKLQNLNRHLATEAAKIKKRDVAAFCEQLKKNGQITPGLERFVRSYLLSLDNTQPIHNFSENGITRKVSALDAIKGEMSKLPAIIKFGEKLPGDEPGRVDPDAEVRKVAKYAEERLGTHAPQYIAQFSELRKAKPGLTAREYGVTESV